MTVAGWALIAWLSMFSLAVLWLVFRDGDITHRLDALERALPDWDDEPEMPQEPAERAQDETGRADAAPDKGPRSDTFSSRTNPEPETVDIQTRPDVPAQTAALPAAGATAHRPTEPVTELPPTRRGGGRWVTGPGGSLVYRPPGQDGIYQPPEEHK